MNEWMNDYLPCSVYISGCKGVEGLDGSGLDQGTCTGPANSTP